MEFSNKTATTTTTRLQQAAKNARTAGPSARHPHRGFAVCRHPCPSVRPSHTVGGCSSSSAGCRPSNTSIVNNCPAKISIYFHLLSQVCFCHTSLGAAAVRFSAPVAHPCLCGRCMHRHTLPLRAPPTSLLCLPPTPRHDTTQRNATQRRPAVTTPPRRRMTSALHLTNHTFAMCAADEKTLNRRKSLTHRPSLLS
ncbi:hypothetical protein BKA81DRAFT_352351 [Phyllosticta paracitricarpa]